MDTHIHTHTSREGQGGADHANCLSPRIKWEVIFWGPKGRMENDKINECSFLSLLFLSSAPLQKKNDLPESFCRAGWHNRTQTCSLSPTHTHRFLCTALFGPHCCWLCVIWWMTPPFQLLPLLRASSFLSGCLSHVDAPYNHLTENQIYWGVHTHSVFDVDLSENGQGQDEGQKAQGEEDG